MAQSSLEHLFQQADDVGVRLEIVGGLPLWEAHPVWKHQEAIDRIRATIQPTPRPHTVAEGCACLHISDVYVTFPDGSLKRPDIAIFCSRPAEEETAITLIPEAVIEVVSKGYEAKDLEFAPRFYLAQGIKDVVVFDPYTSLVLHFRREKTDHYLSPVTLDLECGCRCVV